MDDRNRTNPVYIFFPLWTRHHLIICSFALSFSLSRSIRKLTPSSHLPVNQSLLTSRQNSPNHVAMFKLWTRYQLNNMQIALFISLSLYRKTDVYTQYACRIRASSFCFVRITPPRQKMLPVYKQNTIRTLVLRRPSLFCCRKTPDLQEIPVELIQITQCTTRCREKK